MIKATEVAIIYLQGTLVELLCLPQPPLAVECDRVLKRLQRPNGLLTLKKRSSLIHDAPRFERRIERGFGSI